MCNGKCKCVPSMIAKTLVSIGGLNWGVVGAGLLMGKTMEEANVLHMVLGFSSTVEGIVYVLVGIAAIIGIVGCRCKKCMTCGTEGGEAKMPGNM